MEVFLSEKCHRDVHEFCKLLFQILGGKKTMQICKVAGEFLSLTSFVDVVRNLLSDQKKSYSTVYPRTFWSLVEYLSVIETKIFDLNSSLVLHLLLAPSQSLSDDANCTGLKSFGISCKSSLKCITFNTSAKFSMSGTVTSVDDASLKKQPHQFDLQSWTKLLRKLHT